MAQKMKATGNNRLARSSQQLSALLTDKIRCHKILVSQLALLIFVSFSSISICILPTSVALDNLNNSQDGIRARSCGT